MKKLLIPERKVLYKLYTEEEKSMSDIAVLFNTSAMTVRSWLNKSSIITRPSKKTVYHELRETKLSAKQTDLIIGSVLGDGCLRLPRYGKNAKFSEKHCEKQKDYLMWKRNILLPFVKSKVCVKEPSEHKILGVNCSTQRTFSIGSISHPDLTKLWSMFYVRNGRKIIPTNLEDYLNLFVIAVWFCDDGCLNKNNGSFILYSENFSFEENILIKQNLSKYFSGKISIHKRKNKDGSFRYRNCLIGKDKLSLFLPTLKEFVPECMHYKFSL
jgi:hypothetical protein